MPDVAQTPLQYVVPLTLTLLYPHLRDGAHTVELTISGIVNEGDLKAAMNSSALQPESISDKAKAGISDR